MSKENDNQKYIDFFWSRIKLSNLNSKNIDIALDETIDVVREDMY